ncbi:PREDICTED: peptidyl-prolyl cis-trans isomerase FKBP62-like [Camelina sativa]|uniref:peptidylprolyl isomerase n=1 Tax=Camelina sativa TaxID=90675 RepID=A0ABM0WT84_CAMSA|nr:PREDICTED: peptidyl-prolyl cis-trans isomerase FKBP62-like [Camelina sativa]
MALGTTHSSIPWLVWFLWKDRNNKVFQGLQSEPIDIINQALRDQLWWKESQLTTRVDPVSTDSLITLESLIHCQVDGSWKASEPHSGLGWWCGDGENQTLVMGAKCQRRSTSPLHSELEALLWAMECIRSRGIDCRRFETDSTELLAMVQSSNLAAFTNGWWVDSKKILKEWEGYERPNDGAVVKVKLIGKLQDETVFLKKGHGENEELFEFKPDEEQVVDGLDRAVMKMKKGEVSLVTVELEYAFGSNESKQELAVALPISTVYFELDLVTYDKERESWDMNTEEKIEGDTKKEEENSKFKAGKYALASKRYKKVYNNMNCPLICEFYRRAQAYMELADLDLAEFDVKKALEIDPTNMFSLLVLYTSYLYPI